MPVAHVSRQDVKRNATTTLIRAVPDEDRHKICSIYPHEFVFATHKNPILPACDKNAPKEQSGEVDGIKYTFVEIGPGRSVKDDSVDTGSQFIERYEVRQEFTGKRMAYDVMGYSFNQNGEMSDTPSARTWRGRGVFVPEGDVPTKDELLAAQKAWYETAVIEYDRAQSDWAQYRKTSNIDDHQRLAAHLLNKNPEWLGGLESATGPKPKSEIEQLTDLVKVLLADRLQGSVPAGNAAAPVVKGK
jgi:hypothetical protein